MVELDLPVHVVELQESKAMCLCLVEVLLAHKRSLDEGVLNRKLRRHRKLSLHHVRKRRYNGSTATTKQEQNRLVRIWRVAGCTELHLAMRCILGSNRTPGNK
eukprot:scaffold44867_cov19-Tisochrysis_lutea.AAC.4